MSEVLPPPSPKQLDAGEQAVADGLNAGECHRDVARSVWVAMRAVRNGVGRPVLRTDVHERALAELRDGASRRGIRRRYKLSGSVVERLYRESGRKEECS